MRLPDMTSSHVARNINSLCQSIPTIIGLTGHCPKDIAAELESSCIQFCIQKPMGLSDLSNALMSAINGTAFDWKKKRGAGSDEMPKRSMTPDLKVIPNIQTKIKILLRVFLLLPSPPVL